MPSSITPAVDSLTNGQTNWGPAVKQDIDALSVQMGLAAINTYRVGSASALSSITGMRTADLAVRTDTGVTYRYDGAGWKAWDSGWFDFSGYALSGLITGNATKSARYCYRAGRLIYEGSIVLAAGNGFNANAQLQLPVNADAGPAYGQMPGRILAKNSSDSNRPYELTCEGITAGLVEIRALGPSSTSGGVGNSTNNPGIHNQIIGSIPFNEPWGQNDYLGWQLEYDPA